MTKKIKKVTTTITEEIFEDVKESTHIVAILDTSGSMGSLIHECIGGFNNFLKSQRELAAGECTISIVLFDDLYEEIVKNQNIKDVKDLTSDVWVPRGMTALYDAIGKTITSERQRISKLENKPSKVLVCIVTDGEENSSKEYDNNAVRKLIKDSESNDNWTFTYLATGQNAFRVGTGIGISGNNTFTFTNSASGVNDMYSNIISSTLSYRNMSSTDPNFKKMSSRLINTDPKDSLNVDDKDVPNTPLTGTATTGTNPNLTGTITTTNTTNYPKGQK